MSFRYHYFRTMIDLRDFECRQFSRSVRAVYAIKATMALLRIMRSTFSMANNLSTWHAFSPCSPYSPNSNRFFCSFVLKALEDARRSLQHRTCVPFTDWDLSPPQKKQQQRQHQIWNRIIFVFIVNYFRFTIAFGYHLLLFCLPGF